MQPTPELLAELERASQRLESATPEQVLKWAVERFAPHFTMATAFGPEGMCIIHMLSRVAPNTPIVNLDTGYQFAETLELRERVKDRYGIEVKFLRPEQSVAEYEAANGGPVYKKDPDRCCMQRKLSLMSKAAEGYHAWAVGIRRDQSEHRANAPIVGWDKKFNLVKVSPLATWTKKQVWALIVGESIPYNPLHDQGIRVSAVGHARAACCLAKMNEPVAGVASRKPSAVCTVKISTLKINRTMQLPIKAHYATVAMLALAQSYGQGRVLTVRTIADEHDVPAQFLVQILQQLRAAGLITSTRGSNGGFRLERAPSNITLADVIDAVCPPGSSNTVSSTSPLASVMREVWSELSELQHQHLARMTLSLLCERTQENSQAMFYI